MNLVEGFVKNEIFIDFGEEILYRSSVLHNAPLLCRFPTVTFSLWTTNGLNQIADRIRTDLGFVPMHPMDKYTHNTCDNDGWYDFRVGINGYRKNHMDSCIEFTAMSTYSPDEGKRYTIDLTEEEQKTVFSYLDEQCQKYLGKSCEGLLKEAEKQMMEDEGEQGTLTHRRSRGE